jgi:hypothetical protein
MRTGRPKLAVLLLLMVSVSARAGVTLNVHGQTVTCDDLPVLDKALRAPDHGYFANWQDTDWYAAHNWIDYCEHSLWKGVTHSEAEHLALLDQEKQYQDALIEMEQDKIRVQRTAAEAARQQRQMEHRQCAQTPLYSLWEAQERVMTDVEAIKTAKAGLAREKQIGRVSGAENLAAEHQFGAQVVDASADLSDAWRDYRRQGGRVADPEKVTHTPDPCGDNGT